MGPIGDLWGVLGPSPPHDPHLYALKGCLWQGEIVIVIVSVIVIAIVSVIVIVFCYCYCSCYC